MIRIKKHIKKILLGFTALVGMITALAVPSLAYSEDSEGNLVSDNIYDIGAYNGTINGVSMNVENQTLTLNGTSTNGSWNNRTDLSVTLEAGTYTMQWFTDYVGNNIGFGLRSSGTGLTELYQLNTQRYKTFTISEATTFTTIIWWQTSGLIFDNVKVSCMVYEGNYKAYTTFDPYGAIYYKNRYITDASVLDYSNISKGYINFNGLNNQLMQFGFIYNGLYGRYNDTIEDFEWSGFTYDTDNFIKNKINSNYGAFYNTEWTMYDLLSYYVTGYTSNDNVPLTLTYEFITPINLQNVGFDMGDFDYLSFYDFNGYLLDRVSRNDNRTLTFNNIGKIVGERHLNDIPEDILYIASSLSSGYYDLGYKAGYNNGYSQGTQDGKENALDIGYQEGYREGKIEGYDEGYNEALGEDISTRGFWGLLNSIMSYPINMIRSVFNFEFMGINIAGLITFIVSIVIVIFIVHRFKK